MNTTNVKSVSGTTPAKSVLFGNTNEVKNEKNVTPVTVVIPDKKEKKEAKPKNTEAKPEAVTKVEEIPVSLPQRKIPSIRELQEKAEKMHLLSERYNVLSGKKQQLEVFSISHDGETAGLYLTDAKGTSFNSSNPVCIRKLIEIWKQNYSEALEQTEKEMRTLLEE